jgi:hypothetical protein
MYLSSTPLMYPPSNPSESTARLRYDSSETHFLRLTITQRTRDIGGAWAGGDDGMTVTNVVLQHIPVGGLY